MFERGSDKIKGRVEGGCFVTKKIVCFFNTHEIQRILCNDTHKIRLIISEEDGIRNYRRRIIYVLKHREKTLLYFNDIIIYKIFPFVL